MLIDYDKAVWAVAVQLAFEADMECPGNHHPEDYLSTAKMYFNKIEAIEEPKTGRWIEEYNGNGWNDYWDYTCSVCEKTLKRGEPYPYCPNCGAKMEGGQ